MGLVRTLFAYAIMFFADDSSFSPRFLLVVLGSAFGEGIKNVFGALSLKFMRHETKNEASALFCSFSFFFAKVWLDDGVLKANHSQLDRTVGSVEGKITHTHECVLHATLTC